jgi:DNA-binding CsgD family transcriptional regulator
VDPADAEEYTQAVEQVMGGGWRQIQLAHRLGVPDALGLSTKEWAARVGGYMRLTIDEREEAVKELTEGDDPLNNYEVAEILGVSEGTVRNDRRRAQSYAESDDAESETSTSVAVGAQSYAESDGAAGTLSYYRNLPRITEAESAARDLTAALAGLDAVDIDMAVTGISPSDRALIDHYLPTVRDIVNRLEEL